MSTGTETDTKPAVPRPEWAEGILYADEWASNDRYFAPAGRLKEGVIPGEYLFRLEIETTGRGMTPQLRIYVDGMQDFLVFDTAAQAVAFADALRSASQAFEFHDIAD